MKTIKKNVYYCDFCGKRGLSAGHMKKHEKHCIRNIDRECGLCKFLGEPSTEIKPIIEAFKKRFVLHTETVTNDITETLNYTTPKTTVEWIGKPVTMGEIRDSVNDCPNCILAILVHVGFNRFYFRDEYDNSPFDFDYKKENREVVDERYRELNKEEVYWEY